MLIFAGIEKSKFQTVLEQIDFQLNEIKKGNFSEKEILYAKNHIKTELNSVNDSQAAIEGFFYTGLIVENPIDLQEFVGKILNVTREEIIESAKNVKLDTIFFLEEK
jgi:predicted Zn-dependent peptidase